MQLPQKPRSPSGLATWAGSLGEAFLQGNVPPREFPVSLTPAAWRQGPKWSKRQFPMSSKCPCHFKPMGHRFCSSTLMLLVGEVDGSSRSFLDLDTMVPDT